MPVFHNPGLRKDVLTAAPRDGIIRTSLNAQASKNSRTGDRLHSTLLYSALLSHWIGFLAQRHRGTEESIRSRAFHGSLCLRASVWNFLGLATPGYVNPRLLNILGRSSAPVRLSVNFSFVGVPAAPAHVIHRRWPTSVNFPN